eukprot:7906784-Pyramimonas_sp.AAC.2
MVAVPTTVFWHDGGMSGRSNHIGSPGCSFRNVLATRKNTTDSRRWCPKNCVLAQFRIFKRLFSNWAVSSV